MLSTVVTSSGLVSKDDIDTVFKNQALAAFENHPHDFDDQRHSVVAVWHCSGFDFCTTSYRPDSKVSYLRYKHQECGITLRSGLHQWKIENVDEIAFPTGISIGITRWDADFGDDFTIDEGFWGISRGNHAMADGSIQKLRVGDGNVLSSLTFVLDLRQGTEGNGTLRVLGNDGLESTIGSDLLETLKTYPNGFRPVAVSANTLGALRVVDFEKVRD